jgi:hypothetical protein
LRGRFRETCHRAGGLGPGPVLSVPVGLYGCYSSQQVNRLSLRVVGFLTDKFRVGSFAPSRWRTGNVGSLPWRSDPNDVDLTFDLPQIVNRDRPDLAVDCQRVRRKTGGVQSIEHIVSRQAA